MTLDEVKRRLSEAGYQIEREDRLGNDTGTQLRFRDGGVVNVFDNGNFKLSG